MFQKVLISMTVLSCLTYAELRDQPIYPLSLHSIEYFTQNEIGVLTPINSITAISKTDIYGNKSVTTEESSIAGTYVKQSFYDHNGKWIKDIQNYQGRGTSDSAVWSYDDATETALYTSKGKRVPNSRSYEKSSNTYNESGLLLNSYNFRSYSSSMNPTDHYTSNANYFYSDNKLDSVKVDYNTKHLLEIYHYNQLPEHEEITIARTFSRGDSTWDGNTTRILRAPMHSTVISYTGNRITGTVKTSYNENKQITEICTMNEIGDTINLTETSYTDEGYIHEIRSSSSNMGELQVQELQRYRYSSETTAVKSINKQINGVSPRISMTQGIMKIELPQSSANSSLTIVNSKGRVIRESSFSSAYLNLNINTLASGVYFATIKTGVNTFSFKFMK